VKTAGDGSKLEASADRSQIRADGKDLAFIAFRVLDKVGLFSPRANHGIKFAVEGPGRIVATDNGDPTDFVPFPSTERAAFNGMCLVIVRGIAGEAGLITVKAESPSLDSAIVEVRTGE
jgi:beta-galactosidase